jgi:hypothetical protein
LFTAFYLEPEETFLLVVFPAYGNSRPSVSEEELKQKQSNVKNGISHANPLASRRTVQPIGDNTETNLVMSEDDSGPITQKGMVLPFLPLSLSFDDIRYSVDMPQVSR